MHDVPYSIKYQLEKWNGFKLTAGVNGVYEFENNYPEPPSPYVGDYEIPNYHLFDLGGYGIVSKDWKKLTLSAGLRYDMRSIVGDPMYLLNYATYIQTVVPEGTQGAYQQFPAFNNTYTGYSGSLGASYQLPAGFYVKGNVGKSYRAPAINELTANELDPSNEFKQGNPNLKAEQGVEADAAFGNYSKDVGFEVDAFYNYINNFITADRIPSATGGDSIELGAPVYKYQANSAIVEGITAYLHVHPQSAPWFRWDNGFTYIYTFMPGATDSTDHVEFTPAPRLTSSVRVTLPKAHGSSFADTYFQFGVEHDWPQNNIYSALWNELPSLAYTLLDASIGTNIINPQTKRVLFSVFISGTNLANISYIDHTSRPQYFWAYNGYLNPTNFGAAAAIVTNRNEGIFNMGRNISFKVLIPFGGHQISETEMQGMKQY